MTKFSGLPANIAPALADYLISIQDSGPTDVKITLQDLINFLGANGYNPYKFSIYLAAIPALTASTWTKVPFDTKEFDTSGNFDNTTNYRFTASVAGFYLFSTKVTIGTSGISSTAYAEAAIYKNGTAIKSGQQIVGAGNPNTIPAPQVTTLIQLNATDYIEVYAYCSEGSRFLGSGSANTYLSGYLVSAT